MSGLTSVLSFLYATDLILIDGHYVTCCAGGFIGSKGIWKQKDQCNQYQVYALTLCLRVTFQSRKP